MTWGPASEPKGRGDASKRPPASEQISRARASAPWAELHCHSSYSFLDGASSPAELAEEAGRLGVTTLAITDHDGMYGVPQFAQAAARSDLKTVFGAELSLDLPSGQSGVPDPAGRHLLILARDPEGYRRLCAVISAAQLAGGQKGKPLYDIANLAAGGATAGGVARAGGALSAGGATTGDGHWVLLTGCGMVPVPPALAEASTEEARGDL